LLALALASHNNEQGDPYPRLNLQQPSVSMGYLQMSSQENGSGKFLQGVKVGEKVAQVMKNPILS